MPDSISYASLDRLHGEEIEDDAIYMSVFLGLDWAFLGMSFVIESKILGVILRGANTSMRFD